MAASSKFDGFGASAIAGVIEQMAAVVCAADAELLAGVVAFDRAEHWRETACSRCATGSSWRST